MNATHSHTFLRLEPLERRQVLAGNLTASVAFGELTITGDNLDNGVLLTQVAVGQYKVRGTVAGGTPTTVNGVASADISGVTGAVNFFTQSGDDNVEVRGVSIPHDLRVGPGDGNDTISVFDTRLGANLEMDTGTGDDIVTIQNVTVESARDGGRGGVIVSLGDGNNTMIITGLRAAGIASINTGTGNDTIKMSNSSFGFGVTINTNNGSDNVALTQVSCRHLTVGMSGGNDTLTIERSTSLTARLFGGPGSFDRLRLVDNLFGRLDTEGFELI